MRIVTVDEHEHDVTNKDGFTRCDYRATPGFCLGLAVIDGILAVTVTLGAMVDVE
jgi:hypothetical protein